jgi:hypothetical protein
MYAKSSLQRPMGDIAEVQAAQEILKAGQR